MDSIAKVEYSLRSLTTRSVILFPARAQVFRDIKDVPLQPGVNEITVFGLTPTIDKDSIKVEGSGSAIISDIAVESLPNREIFDEIYPDSDEEKSSDAEESEDEEPDFPESPELQAAKARTRVLEKKLQQVQHAVQSGVNQHTVLDDYSRSLSGKNTVIPIEDFLESYKRASDRISSDHTAIKKEEDEIQDELRKSSDETNKLLKRHRKEKKQAIKHWKKSALAKTKNKLKEARREEERIKERERVRKEHQSFWPKFCYAVRIQLTANAVTTPMSSRRGSISSETEYAVPTPQDTSQTTSNVATCNLVLSYVTSSAFWTPSYDLQLSTTTGKGTLCFDAQVTNKTSETWSKCKIILSTSQVSTSSLKETLPALVPWRITIGQQIGADNGLLQSGEERHQYSLFWRQKQAVVTSRKRGDMFGASSGPQKLSDYQMQLMMLEQQNKKRLMMARQEQNGANGNSSNAPAASVQQLPRLPHPQAPIQPQTDSNMQQQRQQQLQQQLQQQQQQQAPSSSMLHTHESYQMQNIQPMAQPAAAAPAQQSSPRTAAQYIGFPGSLINKSTDVLNDFDFDSFLEEEEQPRLDFEESQVDETGFTTTYDLPGQKTLVPKSNSSKQRVARINFNNVAFSHTVIAKYKPVAHLSAKLLNSSKLTLLRGMVGVTLDGSFMGRTNLARCGSGESINLGLGADPAIRVTYPKPEVKRATTGYFTKEDIKIFERCIQLENTRQAAAKPVKLFVMDQIPVPDNESVRVELLKPEGVLVNGEWKSTGLPGRERNEDDKDWGTAVANQRKGGEVIWNVVLGPGKALKLPLEYLVAVPIGEHAVQS